MILVFMWFITIRLADKMSNYNSVVITISYLLTIFVFKIIACFIILSIRIGFVLPSYVFRDLSQN